MEGRRKQKNRLAELVPPYSEIEGRFLFVEDDVLRQNITISLQYILVLIGIIDKEDADNTIIASSFRKNIIVNTATIAEGCLHYCLRKYIDSGKISSSEIMPSSEKYKNCKILYKISDTEDVCGVIRSKQLERLNRSTTFQSINRAAKKAEIIDSVLFEELEALREQRNKIHLAGLSIVDIAYNKAAVNEIFLVMTKTVECVENKILLL